MMKEGTTMKYLKIEKGKGYFLNAENSMEEISKISKEDILRLLDIATDKEQNFEMDSVKENNLDNKAHIIIYRNLYTKFNEILKDRDRFIDESMSIYKDALNKYSDKSK